MNSINRFSYHSANSDRSQRSLIFEQQRLEQLWKTSPSLPKIENHTPWYKKLGQALVQYLTDNQSVRIWTKITPQGTQWCAYDPKQQRSFSSYTETDLQTWLEQRYLS
ncbi:MAG: Phage virion morphogenesis family [Phormidesmis priestleyi Ana]|uniref:Phage virion morphogenesis family n=1 Tax=Phormidesmis priestleyi Ana TaxID=1666911 RepID=A0A0P7ZTN0_9CYAN|nr:MAG: Phage virion morphogenesis family [Phormidesmis priestleyi Ana]